jgi:hypothetical protein
MSQEAINELPSEQELIYDWNGAGEHQWPVQPPVLIDHTVSCARIRWDQLEELSVGETLDRQLQALAALSKLGIEGYQLGEWDAVVTRDLVEKLSEGQFSANIGCEIGNRPLLEELQQRHELQRSTLFYTSSRHPKFRQHCQWSRRGKVLVIQDCGWLQPKEIVEAVRQGVEFGFEAICLSDDTGRCLPSAAKRLVKFVKDCIDRFQTAGLPTEQPPRIEWSGRNDRGMALYTGLAAWKAGASVLHCAYFGIGEGAGLLSTELLLVNLSLIGCLDRDLSALKQVSEQLSKLLGMELYPNLPVVGVDAFRTGTGVHAAAIVKAHRKGHDWLADLIYSGIPATRFGYAQIIEIGPMAGASNVIYWLKRNGHATNDETVQAILQKAKQSERVLTDEELLATMIEGGVSV